MFLWEKLQSVDQNIAYSWLILVYLPMKTWFIVCVCGGGVVLDFAVLRPERQNCGKKILLALKTNLFCNNTRDRFGNCKPEPFHICSIHVWIFSKIAQLHTEKNHLALSRGAVDRTVSLVTGSAAGRVVSYISRKPNCITGDLIKARQFSGAFEVICVIPTSSWTLKRLLASLRRS